MLQEESDGMESNNQEEELANVQSKIQVESPIAPVPSPFKTTSGQRLMSQRPKWKAKVYCPTVGGYISKVLASMCGPAYREPRKEEEIPGLYYLGERRWGSASHVAEFYVEKGYGRANTAKCSNDCL